MLSVTGQKIETENPGEKKFNWADAFVDAGILAFLTFFTSLAGMQAVGLPGVSIFYAASIAASTQFFAILAMKRGLTKPEK